MTEAKAVDPSLANLAARWLSIAETARDGLVTIDQAGLITSFNGAAERIFGCTAAEVLGTNVSRLMPEPYQSEHDAYLEKYQRTGERRAIGRIRHVHAQRLDGEIRPIELSVSEGIVGGERFFTAIVRDVLDTDNRYRLVVDLAASVIVLLSPELLVMEFNREAERVFGRRRELVLERSFLNLVPVEEREATAEAFQAVLGGSELRGFEGLADNAQAFMAGMARSIELQQADATAVLAYKQRLIDYLERFIGDLVVRIDRTPASADHAPADPFDTEIRMLRKALGPLIIAGLRAFGIRIPESRGELDKLVEGLVDGKLLK